MLQGLRSQIYQVPDLEAAKAWYTALLGKPPYFDEPFYVGFDVGGYELSLQPNNNPDAGQARDAVTYWGVPDAEAAYAHLLALGASAYQPVQDVGSGIKLGAVIDPVGNRLGVIENPHFLAAQAGSDAGEGEPGLTFSLHIGQMLLEQAQSGARSASVSLEEYLGECAVDGIIRGYR
jgi:predicted enzyme related to lactoylglutathione lyase